MFSLKSDSLFVCLSVRSESESESRDYIAVRLLKLLLELISDLVQVLQLSVNVGVEVVDHLEVCRELLIRAPAHLKDLLSDFVTSVCRLIVNLHTEPAFGILLAQLVGHEHAAGCDD